MPNLVNSVEAYMKLEKDIFEKIAGAGEGTKNAESHEELESANKGITSLIRDLKVVVEDTPELRASNTISDLMAQLDGTENRIAVEMKSFLFCIYSEYLY